MLAGCNQQPSSESSPVVSLHSELGGSAEGFQRACEPIALSFPKDHAAHPAFRNEWWYFTGNVESESASGKRFGFHVTFFRVATKADKTLLDKTDQTVTALQASTENQQPAALDSAWAANQFYMGHFAITESDASAVIAHERFARAAAGLAGAETKTESDDLQIWIDDWSIVHKQSDPTDFKTSIWQLSLSTDDDFLELSLQAQKPVVEQGDSGYSQKSSDPCNSSYYYSIPRLQVAGTIGRDGAQHKVAGSAWLDREWSSSALADDQTGWDWFALQLDDGTDIMVYHLRKQDGTIDPHSYAVAMDPNGVKTLLTLPELSIDRWWKSATGARYPVEGQLTFNSAKNTDTNTTMNAAATPRTIRFTPLIDNQELNLTVRYWEGAIRLSDESGSAIGQGYLELTGY